MSEKNLVEEGKLPEQQDILMNEDELLSGLLEAASYKTSTDFNRKVYVRRSGDKVLFEFTIRPLREEEIQECRKKVTKYKPDPRGKQFPKIETDVDLIKLRSNKILKATVDTGNGIIWDNKKLKDKLGVLQAVDVIDLVLLAGEKDRICDMIDEISGYGAEDGPTMEEVAKN